MTTGVYAGDTETTGVRTVDQVIELSMLQLPELESLDIMEFVNGLHEESFETSRWKPGVPILPEAEKVHGISMEMLSGELEVTPHLATYFSQTFPQVNYFIGHKIDFDVRLLRQSGVDLGEVKQICTWRLAKKVLSGLEVENFKLTTLVAYFYPSLKEVIEKYSHSAKEDVSLTLLLLDACCKRIAATTWEELYQFQVPAQKPAARKQPYKYTGKEK